MDTSPTPKRSGPVERILIGCAAGCGILIVAAVIAGSIGAFWFFSPGEQVATERIVGQESLGVVRMNELATDPGTQELLTMVGQAMADFNRKQQEAVLPEEMKWLSRFQRPTSAKEFNRFIPKEATLVFEPAVEPTGTPEVVFAANFRTMVRPIKTMISFAIQDEHRTEYRGYDVYRFPFEDGQLVPATFVGSTFLLASSQSTLEKAVDRIVDQTSGGMERLIREVPGGEWDAIGTIPGVEVAAADLIHDLAGDPNPELSGREGSPLDLRFGLDVKSADEISGEAVFEAGSAERARAWHKALDAGFEGLAARAAEMGLDLEIRTELRDANVLAHLRLSGIREAAATWVETDIGDFLSE